MENKRENFKKDKPTKYDIFNLPPRLFKYYGYDSQLNAKRLSGEVYLACPYDFNDPCDCQREVINNAAQKVELKGPEWLETKMEELGFDDTECRQLTEGLINDNQDIKERVHKRMLEKLGILCLTGTQADTLMWGYYANNEGICIEYDVSRLVKQIVLGYINKMNYLTTKFLYEKRQYNKDPEDKTPDLKKEVIQEAQKLIRENDVNKITNRYLREQNNQHHLLNFVRNIFLKRIYAQSIIYNVAPDGSPSTLFYNHDDKASQTKYFKKTKTWSHENEFRFIVSLGGRTPINIGKDCIKNIYLGCNMPNEKVVAVAYLMAKNNLSAGLYKMKRLKNCGLAPCVINWQKYKNHLDELETVITLS